MYQLKQLTGRLLNVDSYQNTFTTVIEKNIFQVVAIERHSLFLFSEDRLSEGTAIQSIKGNFFFDVFFGSQDFFRY